MGHALRWYLPGVVYEFTTRTMQERFLLRPGPKAREIILGAIGRAQVLYPLVSVYAFVFLSNHAHMLLSASDGGSLAAFVGYVNGRVGFEMGRLHGWRGRFWSRRGRPIPIVDDAALIGRLRYLVAQGCKEGLVASPREWPGASAVPGLLGDMVLHGWWFDRDQERRARTRGERPGRYDHAIRYPVRLAPLPVWAHLPCDQLRARYAALVDEVEAEAHAAAAAHPPLGVAAVLAQHPHGRPAEPKAGRAPLCHASSRAIRRLFRVAYRRFVDAFRRAAARLRTLRVGEAPPPFPAGAFPPRLPFVPMAAVDTAWLPWNDRSRSTHHRGGSDP